MLLLSLHLHRLLLQQLILQLELDGLVAEDVVGVCELDILGVEPARRVGLGNGEACEKRIQHQRDHDRVDGPGDDDDRQDAIVSVGFRDALFEQRLLTRRQYDGALCPDVLHLRSPTWVSTSTRAAPRRFVRMISIVRASSANFTSKRWRTSRAPPLYGIGVYQVRSRAVSAVSGRSAERYGSR